MIDSTECHTSEILRFVDHEDAKHFIYVPVILISVTMDEKSLYTSISNNKGIVATKKRYDSYIHKTSH